MSGLEGGVTLYSIKGWRKAVAFILCLDQREGLATFYIWARGGALPSMIGLEGGVPYLLCMGLKKPAMNGLEERFCQICYVRAKGRGYHTFYIWAIGRG